MSIYEHDDEPVRGLPGHLPPGERIVWQGGPDWRVLARTAFHTRAVAIYFAILIVVSIVGAMTDTSIVGVGATVAAAVLGLGLLHLLAWLSARSTVYTLTNRRIVLRFGIALPKCINVPLKVIGTAGLQLRADGTGDLPLSLIGDTRIAYAHLWPHARPWRVTMTEPMLRAVPDARSFAALLAATLHDAVPSGVRLGVVEPAVADGAPGYGEAAAA